MRKCFVIVCMLAMAVCAYGQKASELKYSDAQDLMIINKPFENTGTDYARLPSDMKDQVRKELWDLGLNSAGIAIRFSSDTKCIGARWELLNNFSMSHMAGTGIMGIDFYTLDNGEWKFIGTARPNGKNSESVVIRHMNGDQREYLAYLPLYDGAVKVEVGIDSTASIGMPRDRSLTKNTGKPIVFYGTSITQGGCASRPGMTYTSIIGRKLDCETVNLGFSGNARMDKSMAEIVSRIDASEYVIDCIPNCTAKILRDSAYYFLTYLAENHPETPIFMVENVLFPPSIVETETAADLKEENGYWKELYRQFKKEGFKNIYYIKADGLIGKDNECTVDGCHMTDLGFMRMAAGLMKAGVGKKGLIP